MYFNSPIEVHVTHLVCQSLDLISIQSSIVLQNVIARRRHRALANMLRHQEEIIPDEKIFN